MKELDKVIQEYKKSRVVSKREYRPRNLDLHQNVEKYLKLQIKKWRKEGKSDDHIVKQFQKLIPFLCDEIDEE
jgi:uncharacterized protein YggU (UPF0235/DUF167 family)